MKKQKKKQKGKEKKSDQWLVAGILVVFISLLLVIFIAFYASQEQPQGFQISIKKKNMHDLTRAIYEDLKSNFADQIGEIEYQTKGSPKSGVIVFVGVTHQGVVEGERPTIAEDAVQSSQNGLIVLEHLHLKYHALFFTEGWNPMQEVPEVYPLMIFLEDPNDPIVRQKWFERLKSDREYYKMYMKVTAEHDAPPLTVKRRYPEVKVIGSEKFEKFTFKYSKQAQQDASLIFNKYVKYERHSWPILQQDLFLQDVNTGKLGLGKERLITGLNALGTYLFVLWDCGEGYHPRSKMMGESVVNYINQTPVEQRRTVVASFSGSVHTYWCAKHFDKHNTVTVYTKPLTKEKVRQMNENYEKVLKQLRQLSKILGGQPKF